MYRSRNRKKASWTSPVSISLAPAEIAALDEIAEREDLSRSAVIRQWIREKSEIVVAPKGE